MTVQMTVIDGIRYRPDDAARLQEREARRAEKPTAPTVSTQQAEPQNKAKKPHNK